MLHNFWGMKLKMIQTIQLEMWAAIMMLHDDGYVQKEGKGKYIFRVAL